jgi:hypothetical protein
VLGLPAELPALLAVALGVGGIVVFTPALGCAEDPAPLAEVAAGAALVPLGAALHAHTAASDVTTNR